MSEPPEVDVRALGPLNLIGSGGQGKVYERLDEPDGLVYKEYSPRVVDGLDVGALRRFVLFAHTLDEARRGELLTHTAWPQAVVRRDGVVRGFLMRRVPARFVVPMSFGQEVTDELARVQFLLNPAEYVHARGLDTSTRFRMELLHDTAYALALLHGLGISVGDLSPNNLVFSPAARPRCFFIDCDAMRLRGEDVLDQVETPDWQAGGTQLATPETDVYKFSLLAIRLFAGDQRERDPRVVPSALRPLVVRGLSAAVTRRPTATLWVRQLEKDTGTGIDTATGTPLPSQSQSPSPSLPTPRAPADEPERPISVSLPTVTRPKAGIGGAVGVGLVFVVATILGVLVDGRDSSKPATVPTFRYTPPTAYNNPYTYPYDLSRSPVVVPPRITLDLPTRITPLPPLLPRPVVPRPQRSP